MVKKNLTKSELIEMLENKTEEVNELKQKIAMCDRYAKYEEGANEIYAVYESFKNAGFEDSKAYELCKLMIQTAGAMNSSIKLGF